MNDQQRINLCRKIDRSQHGADFELLNCVDPIRHKITPSCYQLVYDGITVYIGVVFGNIAYYEDDTGNLWFNTIPEGGLPEEFQEKADRAILDYHDSLTKEFNNG